jgi:hypothetical protein
VTESDWPFAVCTLMLPAVSRRACDALTLLLTVVVHQERGDDGDRAQPAATPTATLTLTPTPRTKTRTVPRPQLRLRPHVSLAVWWHTARLFAWARARQQRQHALQSQCLSHALYKPVDLVIVKLWRRTREM